MAKYQILGLDMSPILANLSKAANWFLWTLEQNRNEHTNIAGFVPDLSDKQKMMKGYKELHSLGLIKRIRRGEYIINPKAILPNPIDEYTNVQKKWDNTP